VFGLGVWCLVLAGGDSGACGGACGGNRGGGAVVVVGGLRARPFVGKSSCFKHISSDWVNPLDHRIV